MVEIDMRKKVLLISLAISACLLTLTSIITQDVASIINVGVISIFIIVTPSFLYRYSEFLLIKAAEKEFPNFIRDLASMKRSGMTLPDAVRLATKTNYGKLTPEIEKLANRLSWNVPFLRALEIFGRRFKSRVIREAIDIIKESYVSGGDIASILDSLARDMFTLRELEEDRRNIVRQHVMVMYATFFIFIGISLGIILVLAPMFSGSSALGGLSGSSFMGTSPLGGGFTFNFRNPCETAYLIFPCDFFGLICTAFNISGGVGCYYTALFFSSLIIEAIFMGLLTGQLSENSAFAGIKHSLIMLALLFVIFTLVTKLNIIKF
ncbi:MAG TPA: hypothetical protein ENG42_01195 [Candidatus Aenigmarchaeota archaeon]|nr:MAG: hypothetical protein DRP03_00205 [Candidatus Aenigmarchaeota archaeon]HDD46066.1 hypothetical protein [Candidatus Aenigmarchaeota archaeon]